VTAGYHGDVRDSGFESRGLRSGKSRSAKTGSNGSGQAGTAPEAAPLYTLLGTASVLIWSTTIAVSRLVMERLGVFPGSSVILFSSGLLLFAFVSLRTRGFHWLVRVSRPHALRAGPLFVLYMVCLNGAVGLAQTRIEAIVAGLANYIWPAMILVFSILLLGRRARAVPLAGGLVLFVAGILAATSVTAGGIGSLAGALRSPTLSVLLGLVAGVAWGLYSVIGRACRQEVPIGALSLFLLVAGGATAALGATAWNGFSPSLPILGLVGYMVLFPTSLAYGLWGLAMQRGDVATLGALSNLIPVLSAGLAVLALGVPLRWELAAGAMLVSLGAAVSRWAFGRAPTAGIR
jgi:drug/metabolite transporter (DMT)-like permease